MRPLLAQVGARAVDGLGGIGRCCLVVEAVNELNSIGKVLVGEMPDPLGGSIRCHLGAKTGLAGVISDDAVVMLETPLAPC